MSLAEQIGAFATLGSLMLSRQAVLRRGVTDAPVNVNRHSASLPYRADQNRRPYDALFRMDRATSSMSPEQNDRVLMDGDQWIVWRIIPSPAGSHWMLECMAPPSQAVVPVTVVKVPDGMGGHTNQTFPQISLAFAAKIRNASTDRTLTAQSSSQMNRLMMSYPADSAPAPFGVDWRVMVDGMDFTVISVGVDDENPAWRRAVLARNE